MYVLTGFLAAGPVVVREDAAAGLVVAVLEAVDEAVGLVTDLDAAVAVVDLVAAALLAVVELVTLLDRVVARVVVIGAFVTLGLTSDEVEAGPFFNGVPPALDDAPEAGLDVLAGEAVLELVADRTAPIFLSSLAEAADVVRLVVVVLGTGALVVAVAEPGLGAVVVVLETGAGLVEVVVLVVLGADVAEVEDVVVVGLVLGFTSTFETGGFDVAEVGLDDGAAGFFVAGAVRDDVDVVAVLDEVVIGLAVVDFAAKGARGPVVDLVGLGLAAATGLAPGLLNGAFLAPAAAPGAAFLALGDAVVTAATLAPAVTATAAAATATPAAKSSLGVSFGSSSTSGLGSSISTSFSILETSPTFGTFLCTVLIGLL